MSTHTNTRTIFHSLLCAFLLLAVFAPCLQAEETERESEMFNESENERENERESEKAEARGWNSMRHAVHAYLQKNRPSLHTLLLAVRQQDAEKYEEIVDDMGWELYEFIEESAEESAESKEWMQRKSAQIALRLEEIELRLRLDTLEETFENSRGKDAVQKKSASKAEVEKLTRMLFDVIVTRRKNEVTHMSKELAAMEAQLKKLEDNREAIIQKKIMELTGDDLLDW